MALAAAGCTATDISRDDPDLTATAGADFSSEGGMPDLVPSDLPGYGDAGAPQCAINNDGVITRAEAPFVVGLDGLYLVNREGTSVPVTVRPQDGIWDYSAPTAADTRDFDQLLTARGAWWSKDYLEATHAQRLDASSGLLGVYRATADSLLLLGIVSEQRGLSQTGLKYSTPITVLEFPLRVGGSWTSESDVAGLAGGVMFAAHEKYIFSVDTRGITRVPAGAFDSLRLRIQHHQAYGLTTTTRIQYLHLAECFGLVARLRSKDNEPQAEFSQAVEYRRMSTP